MQGQLILLRLSDHSDPSAQGKLLKKLFENFPSTHNAVMRQVLERHQLRIEDVPSWEEDPDAAANYVATLSRDFMRCGLGQNHIQDLYRGMGRCVPIDEEGGEEEGEEGGNVEMEQDDAFSKQVTPFNVTEHEAALPQDLVCFTHFGTRGLLHIGFLIDCYSVLSRDLGRSPKNR